MAHELALHAFDARHQRSDAIRFTVTASDGTPLNVVPSGFGAVVSLPDARPFEFTVRMTPTSPLYWPLEGSFRVGSDETITAADGNDPTAFGPPLSTYHTASSHLTLLPAYLTRLRDRTALALEHLNPATHPPPRDHVANTPTGDNTWVPSWDAPAASINVLRDEDYTHAGRPHFSVQTVTPQTAVTIVELAGPAPLVPQLLAIAWPQSAARATGATSPTFLTYFHANYGQNVDDGFYRINRHHSYPYGWDFLFFGLWRYLYYMGDPVTQEPYAKGIVYQIEAAAKPMVLVLPVHHPGSEVGQLGNAHFMEELLLDVQGYMFRRARNYAWPAALRRAALAGFSASNYLIDSFLGRAAQHPSDFYRYVLQEIYSFDCPDGGKPGLAGSLGRWLRAGGVEKRARLYAQNDHPSFHALVAGNARRHGTLLQSQDGLRSVMVAGTSAWPDAHAYFNWRHDPWGTVHQLISANLLVDAVRRSGA